ncbi:unnamed protein product [Penicillium palitans]
MLQQFPRATLAHTPAPVPTGRSSEPEPIVAECCEGWVMDKTGDWNWVLGVPIAGLSTKSVFERFDHTLARSPSPSAEEIYLKNWQNCIELPWGTCHPEDLPSALVNDLEGPSIQLLPDVEIVLRAGKTAGGVASLMNGSGSTCAFLARDETHARSLMIELQKETVFKEVLMASGPLEGVRVLQDMR